MLKKVNHLAIILDGNRRYAQKKLKEPWRGHDHGGEKVSQLFDWCKELSIQELTLYAFSLQNFKRDKKEVDYLMDLFCKYFTAPELKERVKQDRIKINFIGRIYLLPEKVQKIIQALQQETKDNADFKVNFAMAYGGREELVDAVNKILQEGKIKQVDEKILSRYLYLRSEPDLIIRTGSEKRTSNFLLWQSWYSEWFFLDKLWPEFVKEDLLKVVEEFSQRERRYGK